MSSYPNFYNSYQYNNNQSQEQNTGDNFAGNRQPLQPPQGYVEADYDWNNQAGAATGAYSNSNVAYSRSEETSSSFAHLPAALGSYNQQAQTDENTGNGSNTGLNSLIYASALESSYMKNLESSQSNGNTSDSRRFSRGKQNAGASHSYPSQNPTPNSVANSWTTASHDQRPQQPSPITSQTPATSHANHNPSTRQYSTYPHVSQPGQQSSQANSQIQQSQWGTNYNNQPVPNSSTKVLLNNPAYSQVSHGHTSFTTPSATPSSANQKRVANSRESSATNVRNTETAPSMSQVYSEALPENNTSGSGAEARTTTTEQISPSKVQFVNPTELYTQEYVLAQERSRSAEAAAAMANALVTPTNAAGAKPTKAKATKNSSKKRSSTKKKAAETDPAPAENPGEVDDDMAGEMRTMLEKLRDMRTKDPSLFSKLWDDFKKAPAGNQANSTLEKPAATPNKSTTVDQAPPAGAPASAKKTTKDSLPDLGKFPAQRRRRKTKGDASEIPVDSQLDVSATPNKVNVNSMLNQQKQQPLPPPQSLTTNNQNNISGKASNSIVPQSEQNGSNVTSATKPTTIPGQDATWPAATQQKLAQAASDHLIKYAANKGKECSPESLMLLLKNNPTYPDLCVQLESRGFTLDRQALARFLLAAVPALVSGNNGQEQKKPEASNPAPPSNIIQPLPSSTIQPPQIPPQIQPPQVTRLLQSQTVHSFNAIPNDVQLQVSSNFVQERNLNANVPTTLSAPLPNQKKDKPKSVPRPSVSRPRRSNGEFAPVSTPGPKAEMSKKRLFSEIVDMSQLSSDDDEIMSDENEDDDDHDTVGPIVNGRPNFPGPGPSHGAMDIEVGSPHPTEYSLSDSRGIQESETVQSEIEFDPDDKSVLRSIKRLPNIVKPLNPSAALKRIYYNPKSIARDVLVAAGRHPSERPLNYHLMEFTKLFSAVSTRSDLETFRWDLVDPGGPPMPAVQLEDILVEPPQISRKKRHRSDIAQSRDAMEGKGPTLKSTQLQTQQIVNTPEHLTSVSTPQGARNAMDGTPTTGQRTGRRGRPPGAKNKNPSKAALKATATASSSTARPSRAANIHATAPVVPEPSYPVFTCEWASCPAQLHDVHTLERHVVKIHVPGQTTCEWQNCPNSKTEYTGEGLKEHLEKAHIQPLAWKYGDGASSVNGIDFELDRYLNANGVIVTPDAATAGESDALIFPVEQTPIRAFTKLYGDHTPSERAHQVLRAIQKRRKRVGIGLEQEGCQFSTPIRNKSFVNDEEWYQVVPDEEEKIDDWFSQGDTS